MPRYSRVTDARAADPPMTNLILGYGPMLPLVLAAVGAWGLGGRWALLAIHLALIWGALVLAFAGGVRRGFGIARPAPPARADIAAALAYFTLAGLALVVPYWTTALSLLIVGYVLAALLDARAARRGDAPAHFARLRPPQFLLGAAALAGLWAWLLA